MIPELIYDVIYNLVNWFGWTFFAFTMIMGVRHILRRYDWLETKRRKYSPWVHWWECFQFILFFPFHLFLYYQSKFFDIRGLKKFTKK